LRRGRWDRTEKIYAAIMYSTEALAVISIIAFAFYREFAYGLIAVVATVTTAACHLMLLVYHRTKVILESFRRTVDSEAQPTEENQAKPAFEPAFPLIKRVWALLDAGLDREDVVDITKYCESMGLLPANSSEKVGYVVDAMSKARLGGLSLEEFVLIIYGAARASGLKLEMKELEEAAFSLLRKFLGKSFKGVQI